MEDLDYKVNYLFNVILEKIDILISWSKKDKRIKKELRDYHHYLIREADILKIMWENGDAYNKIFVYNCLLKMLIDVNKVIDYFKRKYNLKINE